MSADNYYVVKRHPNGGFTYVQGFESDDDPDLTVTEHHIQFNTLEEALDAALSEYSEYGVDIEVDDE